MFGCLRRYAWAMLAGEPDYAVVCVEWGGGYRYGSVWSLIDFAGGSTILRMGWWKTKNPSPEGHGFCRCTRRWRCTGSPKITVTEGWASAACKNKFCYNLQGTQASVASAFDPKQTLLYSTAIETKYRSSAFDCALLTVSSIISSASKPSCRVMDWRSLKESGRPSLFSQISMILLCHLVMSSASPITRAHVFAYVKSDQLTIAPGRRQMVEPAWHVAQAQTSKLS